MQASGSFELARNGRKRPTNLLTSRVSSSDVHCYSPSFNPAHSSSSHSPSHGADLPPTPVTATRPKEHAQQMDDVQQRFNTVSLPSINDMLLSAPSAPPSALLTPPASGRVGALAPRIGSHGDDCEEGQFQGPRPTWLQDSSDSTFVGVRPPVFRQSSLDSQRSKVSPRTFESFNREDDQSGLVGLGLAMADATPRIGSLGSNALGLYTPTQATYAQENRAPSAPSVAQEGRFESTVPSSPVFPPLQSWNTDLRTPSAKSGPSQHLGYRRPRPSSIAMEREQPVSIEGGILPMEGGLAGLGVSLAGNVATDFAQPAAEYRVASTSACRLDGPSTSPTSVAHSSAVRRSPKTIDSTGLTPSLSMARIQDVEAAPLASPSSPSLRARSKKRSDLVRRQAEAAVHAGFSTRDATDSPAASASEETPSSTDSNKSITSAMSSPALQPSPRKHALAERDVASIKSSKSNGKSSPTRVDNPASPWGVFRLREEGWKPLGPPGGGKGVGITAVMKNSNTTATATTLGKKQKRLTVSGASRPGSRDNSEQNKENYIPPHAMVSSNGGKKTSSSVVGGKRPSTAGARMGDVFGGEHHQVLAAAAKHSRIQHMQHNSSSRPSSRPSSAQGTMAGKKRSPMMSIR